jgi:hypothetical protein
MRVPHISIHPRIYSSGTPVCQLFIMSDSLVSCLTILYLQVLFGSGLISTSLQSDANWMRKELAHSNIKLFYDTNEVRVFSAANDLSLVKDKPVSLHVAQIWRNVDICSRATRVVFTASSNIANWMYLHRLAYTTLGETGMVPHDDTFLSLKFWDSWDFRNPPPDPAKEGGRRSFGFHPMLSLKPKTKMVNRMLFRPKKRH